MKLFFRVSILMFTASGLILLFTIAFTTQNAIFPIRIEGGSLLFFFAVPRYILIVDKNFTKQENESETMDWGSRINRPETNTNRPNLYNKEIKLREEEATSQKNKQEKIKNPTRKFFSNISSSKEKNKNHSNGTKTNREITLNEYYRTVKSDRKSVMSMRSNLHVFNYIIDPPAECFAHTYLVVVVLSAPEYHARRMNIRETWGKVSQYSVPVKIVFLLGKLQFRYQFLQGAIHQEQSLYKDIVQEDYIDTYNNLTYKTLSGLKWITNYCNTSRFVLKIDDDVFVNMFNLLRELMSVTYKDSYIIGDKRVDAQVIRVMTNKWSVTMDEFANKTYPFYYGGPAYLMSTKMAIWLYDLSFHVPFFRLEDVYVTGFLPLLLPQPGATLIDWSSRYFTATTCTLDPMIGKSRLNGIFLFNRDTENFSKCAKGTELFTAVWKKIVDLDLTNHTDFVKRYQNESWAVVKSS